MARRLILGQEISFLAIRLKVMSDPKETPSLAFLELNHRGKTPVLDDPVPSPAHHGELNAETITINESLATAKIDRCFPT